MNLDFSNKSRGTIFFINVEMACYDLCIIKLVSVVDPIESVESVSFQSQLATSTVKKNVVS